MTERVEKMMENAGREMMADRILRLDQIQSSPAGKVCPINPEHGRMGVHGDGGVLLCTAVISRGNSNQNIKLCNGHASLSIGE